MDLFRNSMNTMKNIKEQVLNDLNELSIPQPDLKIMFNPMQKLFAYWVKEKRFYGNWSSTGVGKTYSFILASRVIESHLTIVICANATKNQIKADIISLYNDSVVEVFNGSYPDFDMSKYNYLIINYEKSQSKKSSKIFETILSKYKIDYLVFDEVHNVKQSKQYTSSRRRCLQKFRDDAVKQYNSRVSVLTATPYVNSNLEVLSILSLLTGETYSFVKKKNKISDSILIENLLNGNGIRSSAIPRNMMGDILEYFEHMIDVPGENSFEAFRNVINKGCTPLDIYKVTLDNKLDYLKDNGIIGKDEFSVVFSLYTDDIILRSKNYFEEMGLKVCVYTGSIDDTVKYKTNHGSVDWNSLTKNYDILLASKPVTTGIDGLQKVCNKMILLTLPWTYALFDQLKGRIYRQGSNFDKVEIIIPLVKYPQIGYVGYDEKVWSMIMNKKEFSNMCLFGVDESLTSNHIHSVLCEDMRSLINTESKDNYLLKTA